MGQVISHLTWEGFQRVFLAGDLQPPRCGAGGFLLHLDGGMTSFVDVGYRSEDDGDVK